MSKSAKIFIDGAAGTTGLEIRERLAGRAGLSLITLSDADRKDPAARKQALNAADVVILCLPDEAARPHPCNGKQHRQIIDLPHRHEDDRAQDRGDQCSDDKSQDEIPELGTAHTTVHVEIMLADGAAEILENRLRIHAITPVFSPVFGVCRVETGLG